MKIRFDVTYTDGRSESTVAHPRSFVAYEKTHAPFTGNPSLSAMMWLAWHALGSPEPFDAWLESVDDVDADHGDQAPFETPPSGM